MVVRLTNEKLFVDLSVFGIDGSRCETRNHVAVKNNNRNKINSERVCLKIKKSKYFFPTVYWFSTSSSSLYTSEREQPFQLPFRRLKKKKIKNDKNYTQNNRRSRTVNGWLHTREERNIWPENNKKLEVLSGAKKNLLTRNQINITK